MCLSMETTTIEDEAVAALSATVDQLCLESTEDAAVARVLAGLREQVPKLDDPVGVLDAVAACMRAIAACVGTEQVTSVAVLMLTRAVWSHAGLGACAFEGVFPCINGLLRRYHCVPSVALRVLKFLRVSLQWGYRGVDTDDALCALVDTAKCLLARPPLRGDVATLATLAMSTLALACECHLLTSPPGSAKEMAEALLRAGAFELARDMLQQAGLHGDLDGFACHVVAVLVHVSLNASMGTPAVCNVLISTLLLRLDSLLVCEGVCSALGDLAAAEGEASSAVLAHGGVAAIVAALDTHPTASRLVQLGLLALSNLAVEEEGAIRVLSAGGLRVALAYTKGSCIDPWLAEQGLTLLANLACIPATQAAVVAADAIPMVVQLLGDFGTRCLPLAEEGCRLLACLFADSTTTAATNTTVFIQAGGLGVVLPMLLNCTEGSKRTDMEEVIEYGLMLCANMLTADRPQHAAYAMAETIFRAGGHTFVLQALAQLPEAADSVYWGCMVLVYLSGHVVRVDACGRVLVEELVTESAHSAAMEQLFARGAALRAADAVAIVTRSAAAVSQDRVCDTNTVSTLRHVARMVDTLTTSLRSCGN